MKYLFLIIFLSIPSTVFSDNEQIFHIKLEDGDCPKGYSTRLRQNVYAVNKTAFVHFCEKDKALEKDKIYYKVSDNFNCDQDVLDNFGNECYCQRRGDLKMIVCPNDILEDK